MVVVLMKGCYRFRFSVSIAFFCLAFSLQAQHAVFQVACGKLIQSEKIQSRYIGDRRYDVWLPEGYSEKARYPVLYVHDGHMQWDGSQSWNKQEWQLDENLCRLIADKKVPPCLVVSVFNAGNKRYAEYFPEKPFLELSPDAQSLVLRLGDSLVHRKMDKGRPYSDDYLKFLVYELKPAIDARFPTLAGRDQTFIMGSSMGGLISIYAMCEYPEVFGAAACLSTHWPGIFRNNDNPVPAAFLSYLDRKISKARLQRWYFDHGDLTLDSLYQIWQQKADAVFRKKGVRGPGFISLSFAGADHSEQAWAKRLELPLVFLLNPGKKLQLSESGEIRRR